MDRGAWWARVHRATKSQTWLKRLSTHAYTVFVFFFSIMTSGFSRFMHVVANGKISFFFMMERYSTMYTGCTWFVHNDVYVYMFLKILHIFFTHSSINRHLGCLQIHRLWIWATKAIFQSQPRMSLREGVNFLILLFLIGSVELFRSSSERRVD